MRKYTSKELRKFVRLAYCCTANPLGDVVEKRFSTLPECLLYIGGGAIPANSAGYTIYEDTGDSLPAVLFDFRRGGKEATT